MHFLVACALGTRRRFWGGHRSERASGKPLFWFRRLNTAGSSDLRSPSTSQISLSAQRSHWHPLRNARRNCLPKKPRKRACLGHLSSSCFPRTARIESGSGSVSGAHPRLLEMSLAHDGLSDEAVQRPPFGPVNGRLLPIYAGDISIPLECFISHRNYIDPGWTSMHPINVRDPSSPYIPSPRHSPISRLHQRYIDR